MVHTQQMCREPLACGVRRRIPKRLEYRGDPRSRNVAVHDCWGLRMSTYTHTLIPIYDVSNCADACVFRVLRVRSSSSSCSPSPPTDPRTQLLVAASQLLYCVKASAATRGYVPARRPLTPLRTVPALHIAHSIAVLKCLYQTIRSYPTSCPWVRNVLPGVVHCGQRAAGSSRRSQGHVVLSWVCRIRGSGLKMPSR